jgi:hypothetical protein
MRSYLAKVAFLVIVGAPEIAAACSVCFTGRSDGTRVAFIATTAGMTALPLLLIGGLVWWLRRRALQIQDSERAAALARPTGTRPRASEATS